MRMLLFALLLGLAAPAAAQRATVVEGSHVNLRAGKTEGFRVLRVLAPGTPVEILEREGQAARVRTPSGETGWLPLRLLVVPAGQEPTEPQAAAAPSPEPAQPVPAPPRAAPHGAAPPSAAPPAAADPGPARAWALLGVGVLAFLLGAGVGIVAHEAYYRKRLNGLRI